MADTALLVVDAQESFRHRPYWSDVEVSAFVRNLQSLIDGCVARKAPVVQILHTEDEGAFALSSGWVTTLEPVQIKPDVVFHKRYHSALAGTPLAGWLNEYFIDLLVNDSLLYELKTVSTLNPEHVKQTLHYLFMKRFIIFEAVKSRWLKTLRHFLMRRS